MYKRLLFIATVLLFAQPIFAQETGNQGKLKKHFKKLEKDLLGLVEGETALLGVMARGDAPESSRGWSFKATADKAWQDSFDKSVRHCDILLSSKSVMKSSNKSATCIPSDSSFFASAIFVKNTTSFCCPLDAK